MNSEAALAVTNNREVIPPEFRNLYFDLVDFVYYSSALRHRELLTILHEQVVSVLGLDVFDSSTLCLLSSGDIGLRAAFYRANGIHGHRDSDRGLRSTDDLLRFLALWTLLRGRTVPPRLTMVHQWLSSVDTFVVLTDQSITGSSLVGDMRLVERLLRLLGRSRRNTSLLALGMVGTARSARALGPHADRVIFSKEIPAKYSVKDPASPFYVGTKPDVRRLTEWFAEHILPPDGLVHRMSAATGNREDALFGFGTQGWLYATGENTPNTSLPLLWSDHAPQYTAPFPRVSSRLYESTRWNHRSEYLEISDGGA